MQAMSFQIGLNLVTLVMCIVTLTLATAALLPQIKLGLILLRDGVLWAALIAVVGFIGFNGWSRLNEARLKRLGDSDDVGQVSSVTETFLSGLLNDVDSSGPAVADPLVEYSLPSSQSIASSPAQRRANVAASSSSSTVFVRSRPQWNTLSRSGTSGNSARLSQGERRRLPPVSPASRRPQPVQTDWNR